MTPLILLFWILTVAVETAGQLMFKAAAYHSAHLNGAAHWKNMICRPWLWGGIFCYIVQIVLWLIFLSLVDLSIGMMLVSINIVVIMLTGHVWFKEKITPYRLIGILLITFGVTIVGMGT